MNTGWNGWIVRQAGSKSPEQNVLDEYDYIISGD